ncbi:hypothetical protein ACFOEY_01275 [Paracandidimonas soli]|uniref:hypothetical protein n=1 Tax=Paracandidimonas soli TaxID=1917182 RepID=UPI003621C045
MEGSENKKYAGRSQVNSAACSVLVGELGLRPESFQQVQRPSVRVILGKSPSFHQIIGD